MKGSCPASPGVSLWMRLGQMLRDSSPVWSRIMVAQGRPVCLALLLCTRPQQAIPPRCPLRQESCKKLASPQGNPDSQHNCAWKDSDQPTLSSRFLTKGIISRRKANKSQIPSPWLNHGVWAELESSVEVCSGVRLFSANGKSGTRQDP